MPQSRDLIAVVADADIEEAVQGLLERTEALRVRPIAHEVQRHLQRDPGCRVGSVEFLRPFLSRYRRALVVFDRHGCGSDKPPEEIARIVERDLADNGWAGRAKAIVIDPEIEAWLWNGSSLVAQELGWDDYGRLRAHLKSKDLWPDGDAKPRDPKRAAREAMDFVRVRKRVRRSPAKFRRLAQGVSGATLTECTDPAFVRLVAALRDWFPATPPFPDRGRTRTSGQR